ncbi:Uu.00g034770.m01.CDS01 [Anthostomella pinea]|uniref:Uu.00g034770.m01.CDS01 n=1 Tax=Anthostomella pinea TaxID=933095 RepID=A0AAI8YAZ9_9PEZI|nr:Uu.00g034770.m01.CDS01 [Anthostomella pinea]
MAKIHWYHQDHLAAIHRQRCEASMVHPIRKEGTDRPLSREEKNWLWEQTWAGWDVGAYPMAPTPADRPMTDFATYGGTFMPATPTGRKRKAPSSALSKQAPKRQATSVKPHRKAGQPVYIRPKKVQVLNTLEWQIMDARGTGASPAYVRWPNANPADPAATGTFSPDLQISAVRKYDTSQRAWVSRWNNRVAVYLIRRYLHEKYTGLPPQDGAMRVLTEADFKDYNLFGPMLLSHAQGVVNQLEHNGGGIGDEWRPSY